MPLWTLLFKELLVFCWIISLSINFLEAGLLVKDVNMFMALKDCNNLEQYQHWMSAPIPWKQYQNGIYQLQVTELWTRDAAFFYLLAIAPIFFFKWAPCWAGLEFATLRSRPELGSRDRGLTNGAIQASLNTKIKTE